MPPTEAEMKKWFEKAEDLRAAGSRSSHDPSVRNQTPAISQTRAEARATSAQIAGVNNNQPPSSTAADELKRDSVALSWVGPASTSSEGQTNGKHEDKSATKSDDVHISISPPVADSGEIREVLSGNGGAGNGGGHAGKSSTTPPTIMKEPSHAKKERPQSAVSFSHRKSGDGVPERVANIDPPNQPQLWYSDFVTGGRLVQTQVLIAYQSCTYSVMWRFVMDRFPVLEWLPKYTRDKFLKDLQAGLVVGCMLIPQGMGYADVAGLPYVAGLYSGFAPLMVYFATGTSRQMGIGPVAIVSLLVAEGVPVCNKLCAGPDDVLIPEPWPLCSHECAADATLVFNPEYWNYASCIALMSGVIQLVCAPMLGFVMNFVPHPVISGFTSAGGLIIAMSQLKEIVGFKIPKGALHIGISEFFGHIRETHAITCIMGSLAIVWLFTLRKLGQGKLWFYPSLKVHPYAKIFAKLPWPFLTVFIYIIVNSQLRLDLKGVKITGDVPSGLPDFQFPKDFFANLPVLLPITFQIVIIGFLESIAVETNFATKRKYQVRPTQEAIAQGAANIIGGLTMCYPVVGSFSRSAANAAYESQSPMCNLITGTVIMLTLLFLTKLFYYMPLCCLAAIVIVAALSLVDPHEAMFLWSSSKKEFFLLVLTFGLTAFVALDLGIYVSIALCAAEVLFKSTRPKVAVLSDNLVLVYLPGAAAGGDTVAKDILPDSLQGHDILVVRVEGDLNFSAASSLKNIISMQFKEAMGKRSINSLVFDLTAMDIVDTTALAALIALVEEIESHQIAVFIAGIPPGLRKFLGIDSIKAKLSNVGLNNTMEEIPLAELERLNKEDDDEESHSIISHTHSAPLPVSRYRGTLAQAVAAAIVTDNARRSSRDFSRTGSNSPELGPRLPRSRSQSDLPPLDASNWI